MKGERKGGRTEQCVERRRFLGLLGGAGALGLTFPILQGRKVPKELSLKEADFSRDHDLAG